MTRGARREEAEMRGKKVRRGGDESKGAELGTEGGGMRADRGREVERGIKALSSGGGRHRKRKPSGGGLTGEERGCRERHGEGQTEADTHKETLSDSCYLRSPLQT